MEKWIPDRKWIAAGLSGIATFFVITAFDVPEETATAIVGGVMAAVHYFVPASARDILRRVDEKLG